MSIWSTAYNVSRLKKKLPKKASLRSPWSVYLCIYDVLLLHNNTYTSIIDFKAVQPFLLTFS